MHFCQSGNREEDFCDLETKDTHSLHKTIDHTFPIQLGRAQCEGENTSDLQIEVALNRAAEMLVQQVEIWAIAVLRTVTDSKGPSTFTHAALYDSDKKVWFHLGKKATLW